MQRITDRPALVSELNALMLAPDPQQAALALGLISRLPQPSADSLPGVDAAARDIIARIIVRETSVRFRCGHLAPPS
jgi:ABC-type microcin C transport system permease subunit YejE